MLLLFVPISWGVLQIKDVINVELRAVIVFKAELFVSSRLEHYISNFPHGQVSILLVDQMPTHFHLVLLDLRGYFLDLGLFS